MCASAPPTWTSSCGRSPTAAAEKLRRQIKDNLEEVNQLKMELSEAKREIFKLQNRK